MNLIVARLIGGLGNQFFQYAAGRVLALRHGAVLKLDIADFAGYDLRPYELDKYPIQAEIASPTDLQIFDGLGKNGAPAGTRRSGSAGLYYREPHFHFDPAVSGQLPPVYIDGYWQSARYFHHIADLIRSELTPLAKLEPDNEAMLGRIVNSNAVSVHIRRGDYVTNLVTAKYHGSASLNYYRKAMQWMVERVSDPAFFVFSDDPDWVRDNFRFEGTLVQVTVNGPDRGFRDVQLMSACKHHILANSSFSWWGAWLNPSVDKIVVAPTPWFLGNPASTQDLLPSGWTSLPLV